MSQENVEIVRRVYEAANRRDSEAVLALYDPDVEWDSTHAPVAAFFEGVYQGHEGLRTIQREWSEAFESVETRCYELIDAGADADSDVVSASRYRARGRGSGVEVEGPLQYGVWTIRDGRIVRVVWFGTRAEALEAVGLRE